ncbi:MAG: TIGR03084 family protein [Desulfobacterales bacterium]|nr:MAG: TIGR03084 family protein [Desulfobacterales bacterium]
MKQICTDLANEQQELDTIVAGLDEAAWNTMTPAEGWTIKDQIRHLAYFDDRARVAATDPAAFKQYLQKWMHDLNGYSKHLENAGKDLNAAETLEWWRREGLALLEALAPMDPKTRIPWYGPDMSVMSSVTARLMETWAHGQDIVDALGITRQPTDRLRHVAHLGVRTFGWSYANRQMDVPDTQVRVELEGPSGDLWTWGPEEAKNSVKGSAEDFCWVVAQRRHIADTNLITKGETAEQWMSIAQAFAGPLGQGRKPGMFPKRQQ